MVAVNVRRVNRHCDIPPNWREPLASFVAYTSSWAIFGGCPTVLVMCADGDGGHATLILLPGSRKVPSLPAQNENNKEPSVAAASGVQCTHQNMSKSHSLLLPPTRLSMHDCPTLSCLLALTLFSHVR